MATRREFLGRAAALGAAGIAGLSVSEAGAAGDAKDALVGMQRALADLVRHRFSGEDLTAEMKGIADDIAGNVASAAALTRVPIVNADEPDFVFVPE